MLPLRLASLLLLGTGVAGIAVTLVPSVDRAPGLEAAALRCTLVPGATLAVVHVERDTTLPMTAVGVPFMSASGVRPSTRDTMLATEGTPMPAGRVRLLHLDSATRATLAEAGIAEAVPVAFLRAAPYRADCRVVRWTDTLPFVVSGDTGYVRATLSPREHWVNGVPVLVVSQGWHYPYPYRRGLAFGAAPGIPLAPPHVLFAVESLLTRPPGRTREEHARNDSLLRERALPWLRANPAAADLEPARRLLHEAVLRPDWSAVMRIPSRVRGTYRVDMEADGVRGTWFFRTHDRPGYRWTRGPVRTAAELAASPWTAGYSLAGMGARERDSLLLERPRGAVRGAMAWLAVDDRPTAPGNESRRVLDGMLEFTLSAAPEELWEVLEAFVPPVSATDSVMRARMNLVIPRERMQPELPITLRLDDSNGVRADTTLTMRGRTLRVAVQRVDTTSMRRPF